MDTLRIISMLRKRESIRWKLFLLLVPSLLTAGLLQLFLSTWEWRTLVEEMEQQVNWNVASDFAQQIQVQTRNGIDKENLDRLLLNLTQSNPKMEFVILGGNGEVLSFVPFRGQLERSHIALDPLLLALEPRTPKLPLYGEDPFSKDKKKVFSVAPLLVNGAPGYLYIPLMSTTYEFLIRNTGQFYLAKTIIQGIFIAALFAMFVGFILSRQLTRRFQLLKNSLEEFQSGNETIRIPIKSSDELGQVAISFNTMAERIVDNMHKLREKDQLRRDLIANISHDLRGPVSSMIAYLEKLLREPPLDERRQAYIQALYNSANTQQQLVEDLFELASLEANEKIPQRDFSSLKRILESVILPLRSQFEEKRVSIEIEAPDSLPLVFVDAHMIQRVLMNLLGNALRYTPASGYVHILLKEVLDGVECTISDSGIGIPQHELPFIFDSFYRANTKHPDNPGGTGLGLAIVKKLLLLHGASPRVQSSLNKGSSFSFILPTHETGNETLF